MPEMHLKQPQLPTVHVDLLPKIKEEFKSLKKLKIQNIFAEIN